MSKRAQAPAEWGECDGRCWAYSDIIARRPRRSDSEISSIAQGWRPTRFRAPDARALYVQSFVRTYQDTYIFRAPRRWDAVLLAAWLRLRRVTLLPPK